MHSIIFQTDARTCLAFWFRRPRRDQPQSWLGRSGNSEAGHVKCKICLIKADLTQKWECRSQKKKKKRLNRSKNKTPVRGPIPHWKMFRSCLITWRHCTATFPRADKENHTHPPVFGAVLSLCLSCIVKIFNHLLVLFLYVSCQSSKPVKYVPESLWRNVNFTHPFWFECNQTWIWLSLHNKGKIVIS